MLEVDLMLALKEVLQKSGESLETQFCRVRDSPSRAVSIILIKKTNTGSVIFQLSNLSI